MAGAVHRSGTRVHRNRHGLAPAAVGTIHGGQAPRLSRFLSKWSSSTVGKPNSAWHWNIRNAVPRLTMAEQIKGAGTR